MIRLSRKRLGAFLEQTRELASTTDLLIFDAAAGADAKVMTFARAADEVVLVITPDPASIVDAFATAKVLFRSEPDAKVRVVVNMAESQEQALKVYRALESAVRQFIKKTVYYSGGILFDSRVSSCNRNKTPFVLGERSLHVSQDVRRVAGLIGSTQVARQAQTVGMQRAA